MVTVNETLVRQILDRLIRLETLVEANQQETNNRIDDVNRRIDDVNRRIDDVNARIEESNRATNARIEESNNATNARIDRLDDRYDKISVRLDRLFYTLIGLGVAIVGALVAGQFLD